VYTKSVVYPVPRVNVGVCELGTTENAASDAPQLNVIRPVVPMVTIVLLGVSCVGLWQFAVMPVAGMAGAGWLNKATAATIPAHRRMLTIPSHTFLLLRLRRIFDTTVP
jgi:hypothetical protein